MFLLLWAIYSAALWLPAFSRNVRRVEASPAPTQGWPLPPGHPYVIERDHLNNLMCHVLADNTDRVNTIISHFNSQVDYIGWKIKKRGAFEPVYVKFATMAFHTFLPNFTAEKDPTKRPILLDIGGNIGVYTVCALRNGISAITIEANPPTASMLVSNVVREMGHNYGGIAAVWNVGLGRGDTDTPLCFVQSAVNLGESRFNDTEGVECSMKLPIRSLPTVIDWASVYGKAGSLSKIFYMKMDIERMEEKVLKGSESFLRKGSPYRPCMGQMEVLRGSRPLGERIVDNSLKIMRGYGYCIFELQAVLRRMEKLGAGFLRSETSRPSCHLEIPVLKGGRRDMDVLFSLMGEEFKECVARVSRG